MPFTRVLVSFRDKARPEERVALKDEGFKFDERVGAWGRESTAANILLAKRMVNQFLRERGAEAQLYV